MQSSGLPVTLGSPFQFALAVGGKKTLKTREEVLMKWAGLVPHVLSSGGRTGVPF